MCCAYQRNALLEKSLSELQQRMEIETSTYQSILAAILGKAARLNSNKDMTSTDSCVNLVSHIEFYVCMYVFMLYRYFV